uniref:Uncharacterized protein n=1 Tax=viral metagenome TaxID=1070528 RepID=A0A6C0I8K2_9ZZZZ
MKDNKCIYKMCLDLKEAACKADKKLNHSNKSPFKPWLPTNKTGSICICSKCFKLPEIMKLVFIEGKIKIINK